MLLSASIKVLQVATVIYFLEAMADLFTTFPLRIYMVFATTFISDMQVFVKDTHLSAKQPHLPLTS